MNRLTARDEYGNAYYPKCFDEPCNGGGCTKDMCDFATEVCEKLAAYEDTVLDPEQLSVIDEEYSKMAKELAEIRKYKCLGDLEEVREAVKRQHVMKPILHMNEMSGMFVDYADGRGEYKTQTNNWWRCPCCNSIVGERVIIRGKSHDQRKKRFCNKCGQHIDWSNNERNE